VRYRVRRGVRVITYHHNNNNNIGNEPRSYKCALGVVHQQPSPHQTDRRGDDSSRGPLARSLCFVLFDALMMPPTPPPLSASYLSNGFWRFSADNRRSGIPQTLRATDRGSPKCRRRHYCCSSWTPGVPVAVAIGSPPARSSLAAVRPVSQSSGEDHTVRWEHVYGYLTTCTWALIPCAFASGLNISLKSTVASPIFCRHHFLFLFNCLQRTGFALYAWLARFSKRKTRRVYPQTKRFNCCPAEFSWILTCLIITYPGHLSVVGEGSTEMQRYETLLLRWALAY